MTREIKFRGFNPATNEIISWEGMQGWTMGGLGSPNIMQYTGLKDKNGKEIYEGDIVQMDEEATIQPNKNLVIVDWFGVTVAHPVGDRFHVCSTIHELCADHIGNYKPKHGLAGKIIGNIHENLELLK